MFVKNFNFIFKIKYLKHSYNNNGDGLKKKNYIDEGWLRGKNGRVSEGRSELGSCPR